MLSRKGTQWQEMYSEGSLVVGGEGGGGGGLTGGQEALSVVASLMTEVTRA